MSLYSAHSPATLARSASQCVASMILAERIELLEVHWPTSGKTQIFRDLAADQAIQVTEFDEQFRILPRKPVPQPWPTRRP